MPFKSHENPIQVPLKSHEDPMKSPINPMNYPGKILYIYIARNIVAYIMNYIWLLFLSIFSN